MYTYALIFVKQLEIEIDCRHVDSDTFEITFLGRGFGYPEGKYVN
jgi:hypothetical protein